MEAILSTLGSTQQRKQQLTEATQKYKSVIEAQVAELKQNITQNSKRILVIGGVCIAVYVIVDVLLAEPKSKKAKRVVLNTNEASIPVAIQEKESSWLANSIRGFILTFLLSIAREKLTDLLAQTGETNHAQKDT